LVPPAVEQPQYSLLSRSRVAEQIAPATEDLGVGLVVFSPLAQGMLTGKYDEGVPDDSRFAHLPKFGERLLTDDNARRVRALKPLADELGVSRAQLALAWLLHQPGVSSVITGATRVAQIEENVAAAELELDEALLTRIDEAVA